MKVNSVPPSLTSVESMCKHVQTGGLGAVFWMSLASAPMSPSGTRSSHVARGVVPGGPVCPSRISVSYFVQSCSMRSTYVTSVYGWMLCSARVRAWASCVQQILATKLCAGVQQVAELHPWETQNHLLCFLWEDVKLLFRYSPSGVWSITRFAGSHYLTSVCPTFRPQARNVTLICYLFFGNRTCDNL